MQAKQAEDSGLVSPPQEEKAEKVSSPQLDAFLGYSKSQMSEEFQNLGITDLRPLKAVARGYP